MALLSYDARFPMPDDVKKIVAVVWTVEQLTFNTAAKRLSFYELDAVEIAASPNYPIGFCRFGTMLIDRGQCFVLPFQRHEVTNLLLEARSFLRIVQTAFLPEVPDDAPVVLRRGYFGDFVLKVKGQADFSCDRLPDAFAAYRRALARDATL